MATAADGTIVPDSDLPYYNSILATVTAKQAQINTYNARITETQAIVTTLTTEINAGLTLMSLIADLPYSSS